MGAGRIHHGCCIGADAAAHWVAVDLGIPVEGHPGCDRNGMPKKRAILSRFDLLHGPDWFLTRNETIVRHATELIAVVTQLRPYRSGEWHTIRRAEAHEIPITLILPDGSTVCATPDESTSLIGTSAKNGTDVEQAVVAR